MNKYKNKQDLEQFQYVSDDEVAQYYGNNGGGKTSPKPVSKPKRPNIFKRFWKWLFG